MKNKIISDSASLALARVLSMLVGIISAMILSRSLSLSEYGTYSSGNLIINTATILTAFGLIDAVNYYYNGKTKEERGEYINNVFGLFMIFGILAAVVIWFGRNLIADYFHNQALQLICLYLALRPILSNMGQGMQNLQVSIGKAKYVAMQNCFVTMCKLGIILLTAFVTHSVALIFACMLGAEFLGFVFYAVMLHKNGIVIQPMRWDRARMREIMAFCIPMGLYLQTSVLSRNLDKFVIGFFESTDNLAIYANCSTKLPFDVISTPLMAVLIPLFTRLVHRGDLENGRIVYRHYMKIGYLFTWTLGIAAMLLSKEAILLLYGEKYLQGLTVFQIYLLVDMINFISFSLVLTAGGKTKALMWFSIGGLGLNFILNFLFYRLMGFIGPAVATVICTVLVNVCLLRYSAGMLKTRISFFFDKKQLLFYGAIVLGVGALDFLLIYWMNLLQVHFVVVLLVGGIIFTGAVLGINLKEVKRVFDEINRISEQ